MNQKPEIVIVQIKKNDQTLICHADLIFVENIPHVVLEWSKTPDGEEVPSLSVALDFSKLKTLNWPDAKYIYEGNAVQWPRTSS